MYHKRFSGSHYSAGYKYGSLLYKYGISLIDNIDYIFNEERKEFTKQCIPIYEKYYPEILEEIKGIAYGQNDSYEKLICFLLGLGCFNNYSHCTCILLKNDDNIILGRNSDLEVSIEKLTQNCLYKLDGSYAFNGNTSAYVEMDDGINQYGLAVGMTFLEPKVIKPGINAGMMIRLLLEKCKTTDQAIKIIKTIPISSSQNIAIADRTGNIAVVECNCEDIEIIKPNQNENFLVTANDFNSKKMKKYNTIEHWYGEDDWKSTERYCVASSALKNNKNFFDIKLMKDVLSGKYGFMCQYDRRKNQDTSWSVIYDIRNSKIYRCEGNPSRKQYKEDNRFKEIKLGQF